MPRVAIESDHPLWEWLESKDERMAAFAQRCGFSWKTGYMLIHGHLRHPNAMMLAAIQRETGGEVSIEEVISWQRRHNRLSQP